MGSRILSGTVLLLGLGLVVLPGQVAGQRTPVAGAPPAWATGGTPRTASAGATPSPVIASTKPPSPPPPAARLPLPDDGRSPLMGAPPPAVTPTNADKTPPRPIPTGLQGPTPVRQAVYLPGQDTPPGTEGTGGIQVVSERVAPPTAPPAVPPTAEAPRACSLILDIAGPMKVTPGQPLICTVLVRNPGPAVLAQVRVELPLPVGTRALHTEPPADTRGDRLTWRLGNVEAGTERSLRVELQPSGASEVHLRPVASYALASGLKTQIVQPPFAVTVTAPATAAPGTVVVLQIQLANHSNAPLERVVLRDKLPAGLVHPQGEFIEADVGTLAAGEVRTLRLETRATRTGRWVNEVIASAEGMPEARSQAAVQVTDPALGLKLGGLRQTMLHQELTFQIEVSNPNGQPAEAVQLTLVIPDGLRFIDASTGASYNPATQTLRWDLNQLANGERQMVTFRAQSKLVGDWALASTVKGKGLTEARATHAVHVEPAPPLSVEVVAHGDPIEVGGETTFEVRAFNQGPAPGADVRVIVHVPETVLALRADGPSAGTLKGQKITFEALPQLAAQADAVYRIRVRGLRPGQGPFRAELHAAALSRPLAHEIPANVRGFPAAAGTARP